MTATARPGVLAPTTPLAHRVVARVEENADTVTIDLEPVDTAMAAIEPGQFTMLYAFGVGEVPISASGCPTDDGVLRYTIRGVGSVSRALCRLAPGDPVGGRGPYGTAWPLTAFEGHDVVVIGGGIGLAPLRPVVRRIVAQRDRFGRVAVAAGARTPSDLLYREELEVWRTGHGIDVEITVDEADSSWTGPVGVVTELVPRLRFSPARTVGYVCGPEVMMRAVAAPLLAAGVDAARLFVSLERNMQCGVRRCGHCQLGPLFVCAEGPVVAWSAAAPLLEVDRW